MMNNVIIFNIQAYNQELMEDKGVILKESSGYTVFKKKSSMNCEELAG